MTGYFTQFKYLRGQTLEKLEFNLGFRHGRLSSKGALLYKFLRLPSLSEFEVRGTTIWTEQGWRDEVAPKRSAELAASASYYSKTKVPTFDEQQRRNALDVMSLAGGEMVVKVYPGETLAIDETSAGYRNGTGIPQWRLIRGAKIAGKLLFALGQGDSVPWIA